MQRELETRLGRKLIAGEIPDGSTVTVDVQGGELVIEAQDVAPSKPRPNGEPIGG